MNPARIADIGAATSAGAAGWATFAHINEILQCVALLVAIASGIAAGLYHFTEWKRKHGS